MLNTPSIVNRKMKPRLIVQIYEIQTPREAEAMAALGVDHIGSVILDAAAWRQPLLRETIEAVRRAGAKSSLIPLFDGFEAHCRVIDYYRPDILHFCEDFAPDGALAERIARRHAHQQRLKERYPQTLLMRTVPVAPPGQAERIPTLEIAQGLAPVSDFFLIDTRRVAEEGDSPPQPVPGFVGITGSVCDWEAARRLVAAAPIPVILAGGISADNAAAALEAVRPAGVDSCTHTNAVSEDGSPVRFRKDPAKVARLVAAVRRVETRWEEWRSCTTAAT